MADLVEQLFLGRIRRLKTAVSIAAIERALRGRNSAVAMLSAIEKVYGAQDDLAAALGVALRRGYTRGYQEAFLPEALGFATDIRFAANMAAKLSIEWAKEQQRMLLSLIGQGVQPNTGYTAHDVAELIHAVIGLSPRLANAVIRFRDGLVGEFTRGAANYMAANYAKRLLAYRARMIARSQIAVAENAGQEIIWKVAQQQGYLGRHQMRVWVTHVAERTCDTCMLLDGVAVLLGEPWTLPNDKHVYTPGMVHPHCNCTERLFELERPQFLPAELAV